MYTEAQIRGLSRPMLIRQFDFARFMTESNAIEGEGPSDGVAAKAFVEGPLSEKAALLCHEILAADAGWGGRYRACNVRVGNYVAPPFEQVPGLMEKFWNSLPSLDSWASHNKLQKIHPFHDLNGRLGRLIWLHKAIDEGYLGDIGFLHKFYYQTLSRQK